MPAVNQIREFMNGMGIPRRDLYDIPDSSQRFAGCATCLPFNELVDMARLSREEGIEAVMTIGHRVGWNPGAKAATTSEGRQNGWRLRGSDNISYHIADIMRCAEAGFRGFPVCDEGILPGLNEVRAKGMLPPKTFFKFSAFGGYASAADGPYAGIYPANHEEIEDLAAPDWPPGSEMAITSNAF